MNDQELINKIAQIERSLRDVVISSGVEASICLTSAVSFVAQMIAAIPDEAGRESALHHAIEGLREGVEIFSSEPWENCFKMSDVPAVN